MDAAGGDPSKVLALSTIPCGDGAERVLEIPADLDLIRRGIARVGARLLVIDPLMAFLPPEADAHKDQHVRRALAPLAKLAEETGVAIVLIRHMNKGGGSPLYRGGGSIGIVGAARSAMVVAPHTEDEELVVLAPTKNNLAEKTPSLAFATREAANGAVRIEWRGGVEIDARTLLEGPADKETRALRSAVEALIRDSGGEWEGNAKELHEALDELDLAALPERPDELTKKLQGLARTSATGLTVQRGHRGSKRVLRIGHRHHLHRRHRFRAAKRCR